MERRKTSPIIAFVLTATLAVCSLTALCATRWSTPSLQLGGNVSQYTKPDFISLVRVEHKNLDTTMTTARVNLQIAMAEKNARLMARAYDAIAWNYFCNNKFSEAAKTYERILQICDSSGHRRGVAISYHNLANTLTMMNLYNEANEYEHKAINVAYELNDEELISRFCKTSALMYINHHLYNSANELLNLALNIDNRMSIRTNNKSDDNAYDYMYMGLADFRKFFDIPGDSLLNQAKIKNLKAYKIFKSTGNTSATFDVCNKLMFIYLTYAQKSAGSQRQLFLDSSMLYHNIGLSAMEKTGNEYTKTNYLLWSVDYDIETKQYGSALKGLEAVKTDVEKDPLKIFYAGYGHTMAKYLEAVGDYRQSFEWSVWTTKLEKQQLNRNFAVKSAQLGLKKEQDNIMLKREIDLEHEYIIRREQEIRLVIITASTVLLLIMIVILTVVIRNSLKRKRRLGQKLTERNDELETQRDQLEAINDQLASSINFAHDLQTSMLPTKEQMDNMFGQTMIFWRPLDLVSGDFYWASQSGHRKLFTIADCTGHGVPGGFMSMLGISILSDITLMPEFKNGQLNAGNVLDIMRDKVIESLRQSEESAMALDGMDMALCIQDSDSMEIQFAGAFRSLIIIRDGELLEYKGDKMPISYISDNPRPFVTKTISIEKGDIVFMYSDGITDQFGYNEKGEQSKFASRRLQKILKENSSLPFDELEKLIDCAIDNWRSPAQRKTVPQTDDIIILGIRF